MLRNDPVGINGSEVRPAVSLAALAEKINSEHERVELSAKASLLHAKNAGELLTEAKRQSGHGNWLPWIQAHCHFSDRTARAYMRVFSRWGELSNRQRAANLSLRDGMLILAEADQESADRADLLDRLTPEGRHALEGGIIDVDAARHLLRLEVFDRLATSPPWGGVEHEGWQDHAAKRVLWKPNHARTEEEVSRAVDDALADVVCLWTWYGKLTPKEAERKAAEDSKDPEIEDGAVSTTYFIAVLWQGMRPDFSQLTDDDWDMLRAAFDRYCAWRTEAA